MTISATTQGIRPGVCTSSNRPANPFTGMVVFETDTGLLQIWNGSAWKPVATTSLTASDGYLRYQTSWTAATYNTGWATYSATDWGAAEYFRTVDGMVFLRGLVKRSSGTETTMFTLPTGYRPTVGRLFTAAASGGVARVDVQTSGNVVYQYTQAGSVTITDWLSLNGIGFSVL